MDSKPRVDLLVTAEPGEIAAAFTNNVWLVGNDAEVIVIDPARDAAAAWEAVNGRRVADILLTHGHWDHVRGAMTFAELCRAAGHLVTPRLHPADEFLWREEHPAAQFLPLQDGDTFQVAGLTIEARHTPGHTPGSTSFSVAALGVVFTGDTLFEGGPGATRWPYSSFEVIARSIEERLLGLPEATVAHTGHGPDTTIGAERAQMPQYLARGW